MIESTARAERFDPHSAAAPAFVWEIPQKPVAVHVSLDMVDRLEREVVESFRSVSSRGSEIGGLLLGKAAPGTPLIVTIEDYELVPCQYTRGPLYRLSEQDKEAFDAAIRRHTAAPAPSSTVVGFFRSNTRKGLSLDAEDVLFFSERFNRPDRVVLLVRPFATRTSVAGLFFWEDGQIRADASYLEFPFARHQLLRLDPGQAAAESAAGLPLAGAMPPAPKPAARAQVVPIASRRDIALPSPPPATHREAPEALRAAEPLPAPSAAPDSAAAFSEPMPPDPPAAPEAPPAPSAAAPDIAPASVPSASAAPRETPAPVPAPSAAAPEITPASVPPASAAPRETPAPVPAPSAALREAAQAPVEVPPPSFGQALEDSPRESRFLSVKTILILSGTAVALLLVTLLVYPGLLVRRGGAPAPAADSSTIALRVEREAGQLLLTWNREAQAIKTATRAMLSISDGPQHENIDIDLAQLRNGSVAYTPITSDVSFRLEITGPDNRPQSEYVRVLGTKPSPMPPPGSDAAPGSQPATPADATAASAEDPAVTGQPSDQSSASAGSSPAADSLADRLKPVRPAARVSNVLEPPTLEHAAAHPSASLPAAFSAGAPAPPPAPAPAASGPPEQAPAAPRIGGSVQDARLISRKDPIYPPLAKQARIRGKVQLEATVGKDGRVREVRVLNGHPLLRQAAVDSVKTWIYTPTLLNGVPVETKTRVEVGFNLSN